MKILSVYISKQIIVGFLLVCFSLLSMLWLTQSLRFVEMVTRQSMPVYLFAEMTSLLMPRIFNILSPIAVFVSVLFVYNRLIADRELIVMQATGISPWQNSKAAVLVGLLLIGVNVYVMNYGIPLAEETFRELEWRVKNNLSQAVLREGEFTNLKNGITVFIDKHEDDGSVRGIFVSDESKPNQKVTLTAEKGRLVYTEKGPRILFINGVRQEINTENYSFSTLSFSRYSADFVSIDSKKKKDETVREKGIMELLSAGADKTLSPSDMRKNIVEGNRRIIYPVYNLVFALLGCVGLLVCNFNRRGQGKIITVEILCMIFIMSGDLVFSNMAGRSLYFVPLMYANCLIPLFICLYMLFFYNPFAFRRHHKFKGVENAE
jgi:lipopolysaccharide export system permease protein